MTCPANDEPLDPLCHQCGEILQIAVCECDGANLCSLCQGHGEYLFCPRCEPANDPAEHAAILAGNDNEDVSEESLCPVCGEAMYPETCWQCYGAGGFHDCGEDCCCCADPDDDLNETCAECDGRGRYNICPKAGRPEHGATEAGQSS